MSWATRGSGKSTFLRYVALACAEGPEAARERLGLDDPPLPILAPLAAYVLELKKRPQETDSLRCPDPRWRSSSLATSRGWASPISGPFFAHVLKEGRAILLLDGLDEVTSAEERRMVAQAVEALAATYPRCRFVVTSRIAGYDVLPGWGLRPPDHRPL